MKFIQLIVLLLITTISYAQDAEGVKRMVDFSPKTGAYNIYYPNIYTVTEIDSTDVNIVTISNPETGLNITISSYQYTKKIKESDLRELLSGFLPNIKSSDWVSYKSKFDNLIEGSISGNTYYWLWWGISLDKRMVLISINKEDEILDSEISLVRFMIDHLEIH